MRPVTDPNLIAEYEAHDTDQSPVEPSIPSENNQSKNKSFINIDESRHPQFQESMKQSGKLSQAVIPGVASVFQPEIPMAGAVGAGVNALARVAGGTAANTLSDMQSMRNPKDLWNSIKENAKLNSIIEGVAHVPKAIKGVAEIFNPIEYAAKQAAEHKGQYELAVNAQKQAYEPVMKQYGGQVVTKYPESFLGHTKDDMRYFTPEVKRVRDDFLKNPTFDNLHRLQSQMGKDASKLASTKGKINAYQTLTNARHKLQAEAENYLQFDKQALENYKKGSEITKNEVMPFLSNPTLTKISEGTTKSIEPKAYAKAIEKGQEKKLYSKKVNGKKENVYAIPNEHHLANSLRSLKNRIHLGNAAQVILPTIAGGAIGEMTNPGSSGLFSGGLSGMAASGANAVTKHYGGVGIGGVINNPLVERMFREYINPLYYGGARTYTGYKKGNE